MYLTAEITLLVQISKLQYHSASYARSYHKHFDIKPSTYLTRSKSDSTTIIHTWNHRAIYKFNLFFILPNTPVNVNTPGKSPFPYEYIKIQVHRKAVCVCILIVDPLVIILPLDELLVALGSFLLADEEEFPEHILTSQIFGQTLNRVCFLFGIFSAKYSKILHLLRNERRPNLKVKVRVRSKPKSGFQTDFW